MNVSKFTNKALPLKLKEFTASKQIGFNLVKSRKFFIPAVIVANIGYPFQNQFLSCLLLSVMDFNVIRFTVEILSCRSSVFNYFEIIIKMLAILRLVNNLEIIICIQNRRRVNVNIDITVTYFVDTHTKSVVKNNKFLLSNVLKDDFVFVINNLMTCNNMRVSH